MARTNYGVMEALPYNIIILLSLVFHMLQLESSPVGGSASQSAAQPVDVTPEQLDGSNTRNYQRIDKQREPWT